MKSVDLSVTPLRELNTDLQALREGAGETRWRILNPFGTHAIAVGVDAPVDIEIAGPVGYFCGGMNKSARVLIDGAAGQGVGENMMSGVIHVKGDAAQSAGATGRGGLLRIDGNAGARCGISMKGVDIVVKGEIGHLSAFMGQKGRLVCFGDAGEALGDSIYEARLYVRGKVASLGADCVEKDMRDEHRRELFDLLAQAGESGAIDVSEFRRFGSARTLYTFHVDNAGAY
ncbi:protein glxC [Methylopila musalis]|uniref:Protein glxC n=1 Tax=Methylopila musalis TaxID=1134781 RepID=A0ABW3Z521_9HYPH